MRKLRRGLSRKAVSSTTITISTHLIRIKNTEVKIQALYTLFMTGCRMFLIPIFAFFHLHHELITPVQVFSALKYETRPISPSLNYMNPVHQRSSG